MPEKEITKEAIAKQQKYSTPNSFLVLFDPLTESVTGHRNPAKNLRNRLRKFFGSNKHHDPIFFISLPCQKNDAF